MTIDLSRRPQRRFSRTVVPTLYRWSALAALAGGFVVVPGEALGLSAGIVTFALVRTAFDDLLDRLTPGHGAAMGAARRAVGGV